MKKGLISTIIRIHREAQIELLSDAICSLAMQSYSKFEVLILGQNLTLDQVDTIEDLLVGYLLTRNIQYKIINLKFRKGIDARTKLINSGIKNATGQYLAFLDYDDCLYPWCYEYLVKKIRSDKKAVFAAGLCVRADVDVLSNPKSAIVKKSLFLSHKNSFFDFLVDNIFPIHSFLIDIEKVTKKKLTIDQRLTALEDYSMLLNVASKGRLIFETRKTPICEYRIRNDHSNTTPNFLNSKDPRILKWKKNARIISSLKKNLVIKQLTFHEIEQQVWQLREIFLIEACNEN